MICTICGKKAAPKSKYCPRCQKIITHSQLGKLEYRAALLKAYDMVHTVTLKPD
jgi:uncharacterized OB-fold protein